MHNRHKKVILVSLLVAAFGVMLLPAPASAVFYGYETYTADDYGTDSDDYIYWLHTTVTIRLSYIFIRGRLILTGRTWYRVVHHSQTSCYPLEPGEEPWDYDGPWTYWQMDVQFVIVRNGQAIYDQLLGLHTYVERHPGMSAQSGDTFIDEGSSPYPFPDLDTSITI